MTSKNGSQELVSLLQYMKKTNIDNPDIIVKDYRILELDKIVNEAKATEEWEAVKMNILEIGIQHGMQQGMQKGMQKGMQILVNSVENVAVNLKTDIESACRIVGVSQEEYEKAKEQLTKSET